MGAVPAGHKYSIEDYKSLITRVNDLERSAVINSVILRNFTFNKGENQLDGFTRFLREVLKIPETELNVDMVLSISFLTVGCYRVKLTERCYQLCMKYSKLNLTIYNRNRNPKVSFYKERTRTELANLELSRWLVEKLKESKIVSRTGSLSSDIYCEIEGKSKFYKPEYVAKHFGIDIEIGRKEVVEKRKATKRKNNEEPDQACKKSAMVH